MFNCPAVLLPGRLTAENFLIYNKFLLHTLLAKNGSKEL
jgi:hypothetical protein